MRAFIHKQKSNSHHTHDTLLLVVVILLKFIAEYIEEDCVVADLVCDFRTFLSSSALTHPQLHDRSSFRMKSGVEN